MTPSSEENSLLGMARIVLALAALGILAACGGGTPITSGSPTPSPTLPPQVTNQFPIPTASSRPAGITLGADGQIWFTEFAKSKMGRLVNSGKVQEIVTPTKNAEPNGIASGPGPNINIWFTESNSGKVGQITVAGPPYTEYQLPDPAARPIGIALGSDGNMWVTDQGTNSVWRVEQILVKPHVRFTQYHLTGNAQPEQITNGPDGALWFTEPGINSIGRLPVRGRPLNEYQIPTPNSDPIGIAPGTDNALWFTEQKAKQIGRISPSGNITAEYPLTGATTPDYVLQGIDGNFYFTDTLGNKMGQFLFRSHKTRFYKIPTADSGPTAMVLGPDEQIYLLETFANKIAQFRYFNV
jgi:virginiamycin B lyase